MKMIEKLKEEHQEAVGGYYTGGANGCPFDYGYEARPACQERNQKALTCRECWEREMKEVNKHG